MKRQVTVSAIAGAKTVKVENRILASDIPAPNDAKQIVDVDPTLYFTKIESAKPKFGLLPPNVRWMSEDGHSLVVEEEPGYKNVVISTMGASYGIAGHMYKLYLPRILYGISPDASFNPFVSHIFALRPGQELQGDATHVSILPLPNIFKTGAICTHTIINEGVDLPYHNLISRAISDFWGAGFNYDVGDFQKSLGWQNIYRLASADGDDNVWRWWSRNLNAESFYKADIGANTTFAKMKHKILAVNHTYSFGVGEAERFMTTLVALGLENSL